MTSPPTNLFIPARQVPRRDDPVLPQERSTMEERRRAMLADNPEDYQNESGFGPIADIPVFKTWDSREECARDRMHAPRTAGIWGGKDGAYSIIVSGGYEDDIDEGEFIKYTGAGGFGDENRYGGGGDSWGKGIQTEDQSFEHRDNKALYISYERRKPVRVVRGSRLNSVYAPYNGYRYDGIYKVTKAYMEQSKDGIFKICRFELQREPDQGTIRKRAY